MDECNQSVASTSSMPYTIAPESGVVKKKATIRNVKQGEPDQTCETKRCITTDSELKRYLDESVSVSQPLTWWKLHQFKYLAIPATSLRS